MKYPLSCKTAFVSLIMFVIISSCSRNLMEAMERHKLHDEWLYLHANGRYKIKKIFFGILKMDDNRTGRYLISNDSVFFVNKAGKNVFTLYGYAIVDTLHRELRVRMNDSTYNTDVRIKNFDQKFVKKVLHRQMKTN